MSDNPLDQMNMDYETASVANLPKVGSHVYSQHPTTKVHCLQFGMPGDAPELWVPGMPFPDKMRQHAAKGRKFRGWNVRFEIDIWQNTCTRLYDWPAIQSTQFVDTMAEALAMGLPASLDAAAQAVGSEFLKDDEGHRLMMQLARPKTKTKKRTEPELWDYWDDPDKFARLYLYCGKDVLAEQGIVPYIKRLPPREERIYRLTQTMNERGLRIDLDLVDRLQSLVDRKIDIMNAELADITDNVVRKASNVQALKGWITDRLGPEYMADHDLDLESLSKEDIAELLVLSDLPNTVRRVLEIRQETGKASTAKLKAFRQRTSDDGTAKNGHMYYGASTGRWSAKGIQTQNLARPAEGLDVDAAIEDVLSGAGVEYLESMHGVSLMVIAMGCLRGCIRANEGKRLSDADLAQIEARMTAFLANETVAIDAFFAYDRGEGPDIYKIAAAGIYNLPPSQITKEQRGVGKIAVLALGFGGGAMALLKMARVYFIKLAPLLEGLLKVASEDDYEAVMFAWEKRGRRSAVLKDEWLAAELIKILWRKSNPNVVAAWKEMERAAKAALRNPGVVFKADIGHGVAFQKTGYFLRMRVPAGDFIYFPGARLRKQTLEEAVADQKKDEAEQAVQKEVFEAFSYTNKKWKQFHIYGGLLYQNLVQRAARDVMADAVLRLESLEMERQIDGTFEVVQPFEAVGLIHDEDLSEVPSWLTDADDIMVREMSKSPVWMPGLPVAADGWLKDRFQK